MADVSFNGAAVDQSADDFLCFLIDTAAVEGAVNKGCSLTALECEKLCWVALDFPLGDLEDGFGDLGFVVLDTCQLFGNEREETREKPHTLASKFSHTCLRIAS